MVLMACSSNSKRRKCDGEGEDKDAVCIGENRISRFPDAIRCHILSFLATKDAVRTSILSRQWRYVWTSVPVIEILDQKLLSPYDWRTSESPEVRQAPFVDFVDRVLRLNDVSCLRKFYLRCGEGYDLWRINEWINALISRNVEDLDLCFFTEQGVQLPPKFFNCSKLVCLKLTEVFLLNIPTPAYLPSLKILHLHQVVFCNEVSMKNLLDGCPILEELAIEIDFCPNINILFVRSSSLKSLRLDKQGNWCDDYRLGIVVDATNLERLHLTCDVTKQCDVNNLSSLNEVKLDLCNWVSDSGSTETVKLVDLLRKMSNTKYMCLSYDTVKSLGHVRLDNLPMFHYLTCLELHADEYHGHVFPCLLECSPNLITFLFITVIPPYNECKSHQHFRQPKCLMLYLEEIEIRRFRGCANGMKMVRYFLKNATVLKKMSIWSLGSEDEEIPNKILTFPRSSTACQIAFK